MHPLSPHRAPTAPPFRTPPPAPRIIREVRKPNGREAYLVTLVRNRHGQLPELHLASVRPDGRLAGAAPKLRFGIRPDCLDEVIRGLIEVRNALLPEGQADA